MATVFWADSNPATDGPNIPMEDFLLACRYGYYTGRHELIPDQQYDMLEKEWLENNGRVGELSQPGADGDDNYHPKIKALFIYLRFKDVEKRQNENHQARNS